MANVANTLLFALMGQRQQQQAAEQARFDQRREESGQAATHTARAADEALAADIARQEAAQKLKASQAGDVGYYGTLASRDPEALSNWQDETPLDPSGDIGMLRAQAEQAGRRAQFDAILDRLLQQEGAVKDRKLAEIDAKSQLPSKPGKPDTSVLRTSLTQQFNAAQDEYKTLARTAQEAADALQAKRAQYAKLKSEYAPRSSLDALQNEILGIESMLGSSQAASEAARQKLIRMSQGSSQRFGGVDPKLIGDVAPVAPVSAPVGVPQQPGTPIQETPEQRAARLIQQRRQK